MKYKITFEDLNDMFNVSGGEVLEYYSQALRGIVRMSDKFSAEGEITLTSNDYYKCESVETNNVDEFLEYLEDTYPNHPSLATN